MTEHKYYIDNQIDKLEELRIRTQTLSELLKANVAEDGQISLSDAKYLVTSVLPLITDSLDFICDDMGDVTDSLALHQRGGKTMIKNEELALLRLLPYKADNAVPTAYLSNITDMSQRVVRTIIRSLVIKHGVPIVGERTGSKRGYYIATNSEERSRAIAPLKAEIKRLAHLKS